MSHLNRGAEGKVPDLVLNKRELLFRQKLKTVVVGIQRQIKKTGHVVPKI